MRFPILAVQAANDLPVPGEPDLVVPLPATRPLPLRPSPVERMVFAIDCAHHLDTAFGTMVVPGLNSPAMRPLLSRAERGRALQVSTAPVAPRYASPAANPADAPAAEPRLPVFEIAAAEPFLAPVPVPSVRNRLARTPSEPLPTSAAADTADGAPLETWLPRFEVVPFEPGLERMPVPAARQRWTPAPAAAPVPALPAPNAAEAAAVPAWLPKFDVVPFGGSLEVASLPASRSPITPAPAVEPVQALHAPEAAGIESHLPKFEVAPSEASLEVAPVPAARSASSPAEAGLPEHASPAPDMPGVASQLPKFEVPPYEPGLELESAPAARSGFTAAPFVEAAHASSAPGAVDREAARPRLPKFQVAAAEVSLEPMPVPEACNLWMPCLAAEPVAIEVIAISVPENCSVPAATLPSLRRFAVTDPWMPVSLRLKPSLVAEPVSMTVWPKTAIASLPVYDELPEPALPDGRQLETADAGSHSTPVAPAASALEAEAVESIVLPLCEPGLADTAVARVLQMPVLAHREMKAAAHLAGHAAGLQAEPVETMPSCAACLPVPVSLTPALQLPQLAEPKTEDFSIAAVNVVILPAVRPSMPVAAAHSAPAGPIRTLFVAPPGLQQSEPAAASVAARGFVPLDFYCQRSFGSPTGKMAWCAPVNRPILPGMCLHVFVERVEEVVPQKKKQDHPAFTAIFSLPEVAKRKAGNAAVRYAIRAIAACLVLGTILWFGVGAVKIGNQAPAVSNDVSFGDMASNGGSRSSLPAVGSPLSGGRPAAAPPRGAMSRLRAAISDRAAATVTDSFRNGMEAWGTASKQWAPGWSRNPDGYVQTGQLALFHPSLKYKDYHLAFFGEIENRSMGWTVRATDRENYYAMKLKVIEPGLRPVIAMVHYPVVAGKRGRPVEIPLNIMVHNNKPMQVDVEVHGDKLLTSVDGQLVDTWVDETLVAGGVGFFSEAGERARLYWMRVSRNEDFLGRICAYVANTLGDGSRASAELWPNQIPTPPQPQPVPERTQEAALAVTAVEFQNRVIKDSRRERWNS